MFEAIRGVVKMLSMTRYLIKTEQLMPWIKFIWHFETRDADIHIFGISFYSFGLYPFVHKSLSGTNEEIVDLFDLSIPLAKRLESVTTKNESIEAIVENIENALCLELQAIEEYINKSDLICNFLETDTDTTIQSFCSECGINTKTFTRNFLRYTGYTPKTLRAIIRFQKVGNQLVHQNPKPLSGIAFDNDFADQAHFIREFRKFSGAAPRSFQKEKITIKENTQYSYK